MIVGKSTINQAKKIVINRFKAYASEHKAEVQAALKNDMIGCVYIQRLSPRRYNVGWRFTKLNTEIGAIQIDPHNSYDRNIEVLWTAQKEVI